MYTIDESDTVVELTEVPQSDTGAPCPMILCGNNFLHLAYYLSEQIENWDGQPRFVNPTTPGKWCALVRFQMPQSHMFGSPNDEASPGHPLAQRGLEPYSVAEVKNSSWIRALKHMNSAHPRHRPDASQSMRHFIFAFHDNTFECVADGFHLSTHRGSVAEVLRESWPERLT
jgi:hypothetical protein